MAGGEEREHAAVLSTTRFVSQDLLVVVGMMRERTLGLSSFLLGPEGMLKYSGDNGANENVR